jgi:hypothetical protein
MSCTCGTCPDCGGVAAATNRPGLPSLSFRSGTWSSFFDRMKARLSGSDLAPLAALGTRDPGDFSIALLDAWAAACDVVTFYSERITNEGYLRTAVERRSVVELARLTGYTPRPGLAASVYLAYTMEKDAVGAVPVLSRAQSVPAQGQLPQTFETSDTLPARAVWNNLAPRVARPPYIRPDTKVIYLNGQVTNLKPNDPLLLVAGKDAVPVYIDSIELQASQNRTKVTIQTPPPVMPVPAVAPVAPAVAAAVAPAVVAAAMAPAIGSSSTSSTSTSSTSASSSSMSSASTSSTSTSATTGPAESEPPKSPQTLLDTAGPLMGPITKLPAKNPRSAMALVTDVTTSFAANRDDLLNLATSIAPEMKDSLYSGLRNAHVTDSVPMEVHGFRVRATPFGASAPLQMIPQGQGLFTTQEWALKRQVPGKPDTYTMDIRVQRASSSSGFLGRAVAAALLWRVQVTIVLNGTPLISLDNSSVEVGKPFSDSTGKLSGTLTVPTPPPNAAVPVFTLVLTLAGGIAITASSDASNAKVVKADGLSLNSVNVNFDAFGGTMIFDVGGEHAASGPGGPTESPGRISLDAHYDNLVPGTWVLVEQNRVGKPPRRILGTTATVMDRSRADYGISGKSTELGVTLEAPWFDPADDLTVIRAATVFAGSERLELAPEPMPVDVAGARIELDDLYHDLQPGRWLIVSGERTDIPGTVGVMGAELVMLSGVEQTIQRVNAGDGMPVTPEDEANAAAAGRKIQAVDLPDDLTHSFLQLAGPLSYVYKPSTVTIYGNVVHATHGETRPEVMGSGDGSQPLQSFQLRQPPLTYVAAPTPAGAQSTLQVRVNGRLWHETDTFTGAAPNDRLYTIRIDDEGKTFVTFGNGVEGARLPTGTENVSAVYRTGLGSAANLPAQQINLLGSRPYGVKEVVNPLPSTGGADREDRDSARRNVPLGLTALDRLVSVQDYGDFARTYAGIGKTSAVRLPMGQQQVVHVTVAGAGDIPIATDSDLYLNLVDALEANGDPHQPVQVDARSLRLLVLSAKVQVGPDYLWDLVKPAIISALTDAFGFDNRDLGQDLLLSDVLVAIQGVEGVTYVDVDRMGTVRIDSLQEDLAKITAVNPGRPPARLRVELARPGPDGRILPAELAILDAGVPATLTLTEIPS